MLTLPELIEEWLKGHPSRTSGVLARLIGVCPAEISQILHGRRPSNDVMVRLGTVLPAQDVLNIISESSAFYQKFYCRLSSVNKAA